MSKSLGSLTLDLIAKTGNFTGPLDQAARKAKRSGKDIADAADGANQSWSKLAPVIKGALAGISIGAIATSFISNTKLMEQEQAQLATVLKSTGYAAGFTRDELNDMAAAMEGATTFSTGEINQAQTNLLAFSGVVGDQFKRAMQSVIDMSARTGMAVTASSEVIGRALDIPTAGLGALSKQGFRFTEDQKALVKQLEETGRVAEAQGIILDALEESYAGAAGAARDTFGGALTALKNTIDGAMTGGAGSVAGATNAINAFNDALSSPTGKKAVEALTVAVGGLATIMAGRLVASLVSAGTGFAAAQLQAARYQLTLATMAGVSRTAAVGIGAMNSALAIMGGPVGAVLVAATALTYYATRASDAEKESAELDRRINELGTSFEGLSKKGAEAAIVNYTNKVELLKEESIEAGKETLKWYRYLADAPDGAWAAQYRDNITLARNAQEILSSKILDTEQKITQLKAIANGDPLGGLSASAAIASSTFEKMNQQIAEQIILINNKTAASQLQARIDAGFVGGLLEGEAEKLVAYQAEADALRRSDELSKQAASAAQSRMKSQQSAAESQLKSIRDNVAALEKQAGQLGMTAEAIKLADLATQGATESQLSLAKAALEATKAFEDQKKINIDASAVIENLRTEEEAIEASYKKRQEIILTATDITEQARTEAMLRLEKERTDSLLAVSDNYWERYMSAAEKALLNFDELAGGVVDNFSSRFGSAFESMIFDAENLDDAMNKLAEGMLRAIVNSLGQMAAQWAATQAIKMAGIGAETTAVVASEATKAAAVTAGAATASAATVAAAGVSVAATTAATGVQVAAAGTVAAAWLPAALVASIGTLGAAAVVGGTALLAAYALIGGFQEGGYTGDAAEDEIAGVVHGKEFVMNAAATRRIGVDNLKKMASGGAIGSASGGSPTSAGTSDRLDSTLNRVSSQQRSATANVSVNLYEDASRAGQVEQEQGDDGSTELNLFVADIYGEGERATVLENVYGLQRVGR